MEIKEMKMARAQIHEDQKKIYDKADEEKRDLTVDEETTIENAFIEFGKLSDEIKIKEAEEQRRVGLAAKYAENEALLKRNVGSKTKTETETDNRQDNADTETAAAKKVAEAFRHFLLDPNGYNEYRALQVDQSTTGGYLAVPEKFVADLIKEKDDLLWMRRLSKTTTMTDAVEIAFPELDSSPRASTWGGEVQEPPEDSSMRFVKRGLKPYPHSLLLKVSKELVRVSAIGVDSLVREELAKSFATTEEIAFMTGSGQNQPLGVFTSLGGAGNSGITSDRDISAGNTTTAIKADNLRNVKYALKAQYRSGSSIGWIFHRDGIKMVSKLKDGDGQYLWQNSITIGDPDRLMGYPVYESENAPNTFTTGKIVGILGDYNEYRIVDSLTMTIQVLFEKYATTNQNGYLGRAQTDGMPVQPAAFARIKLA